MTGRPSVILYYLLQNFIYSFLGLFGHLCRPTTKKDVIKCKVFINLEVGFIMKAGSDVCISIEIYNMYIYLTCQQDTVFSINT